MQRVKQKIKVVHCWNIKTQKADTKNLPLLIATALVPQAH